jgi:hypothetical protein
MMRDGILPRADHAVFSDTGWEPRKVYEHLNYLTDLMKEIGMQFHVVKAGNIRQDALTGQRFATMPFFVKNQDGSKGMVRRQCTMHYKIEPLLKKQRELSGLKPKARCTEHLSTTIIGISFDEVQRMRDAAFSWIRNEYPLVDLRMTRQDCIEYAEKHGYRIPPRSACIGCPFKSADEWRMLRDQQPKDWDDAVRFDHQLRDPKTRPVKIRGDVYLHRDLKPLNEVDLRTKEEQGIFSLFDQECAGMCGL